MYLLVDGQALQTSSSRNRGIGRYAANLLRALAVVQPNWRIEVVQSAALSPIAADNRNGLPILSFQPPLPLHFDHHEINERYYADWLTARGADGVLVLSHCENWEAVVPSFCGCRPRLFGIAYDLIPLLFPQHYLGDFDTPHWFALRFRQLLGCDALLAISQSTADDIRTMGGSDAPQVVNIGGAVDPLFTPLSPREFAVRAGEVRKRFGLQHEFILYVGAADYRKNLLGAIHAFAALPPQYRATLDLAAVCRMKADERRSVEAAARRAGIASALRVIASANDEDLRVLYQMCRLFFLPSLYEGLGLPVLEALHCGAPVVASDRSALPEYAGPHSWLCDPKSPQATARVLQQALAEPRDLRRRERQLFAQTFTWQRTAERACAVMQRMVQQKTKPVRRRRLAWVAPFAQSTRRLAEHAMKLLPQLAERFDIEGVAAGSALEVPEVLSQRHLILTAAEVSARHAASPYDMFLYHFGPAADNRDMLALLRRFSGLVVLHDFPAADLAEWRKMTARHGSPVLDMRVHTEGDEPSAAAYADWIERAILHHEQSDGQWRGFAVRCLADSAYEDGAIIDSWAALRMRGRQHFVSANLPSCALPVA